MPRAGYVPKWKKGHKEACKRGHPLTPDNIVGKRQCRICARDASQRFKQKARPRRVLKLECPRGHPRSMRRAGRYDCAACRRTTPRPRRATPITREELLAQRRKHEATRRAKKRASFREVVDPKVVFERDHGVCGICHAPVDQTHYEVDHIVPLSRGGEHSYANSQLAHPTCNRRKWAKVAA